MKTFKQFINKKEIMSPLEIINYIKLITPNKSNIPNYFFKLIRNSKKNFIKKNIKY